MDYRPRCQHCQTSTGPFLAVTLTSDDVAVRDLDPKRTSRMGFVCAKCGETFPLSLAVTSMFWIVTASFGRRR